MSKENYTSNNYWNDHVYYDREFLLPETKHIQRMIALRTPLFFDLSCPIELPAHFIEVGAGIEPMGGFMFQNCWWTDKPHLTLSDPGYTRADTREQLIHNLSLFHRRIDSEDSVIESKDGPYDFRYEITKEEKTLTVDICTKGLPNFETPEDIHCSLLSLVSVASYVDKDDLSSLIQQIHPSFLIYINSLDAGGLFYKNERHPNRVTSNDQILSSLPDNMYLFHGLSRTTPFAFKSPDIGTFFIHGKKDEEVAWILNNQQTEKISGEL